jgi:Flp pilus assembly protein TadG
MAKLRRRRMTSTATIKHILRRASSTFSGQAMVEFALVLFVALIVLFVAIQMAFIGQAALALGQINYQGARFAAVNQCATPSDVATYMVINGSPTITKTCGSQSPALTITVSDNGTSLGTGTPSQCSGTFTPTTTCTTPRSFGDSIQVSVSFNTASVIFLSKSTTNPNFFGIPFPTQLTSQETAMSE